MGFFMPEFRDGLDGPLCLAVGPGAEEDFWLFRITMQL